MRRITEDLKWLWKVSAGVRGYVLASSAAGVLRVAVSMTFVWICKSLVDSVTSGTGEPLTVGIAVMAGCMLMQILISAAEQHMSSLAEVTLKNRMCHRLFLSLMDARWSGKESFHTGDSINRVMEDVRVISESINKSVPVVIGASFQFIAAFIFLFMLAPGLAWTIPCIMVVMLLVSKSYVFRMRQINKEIRKTESGMQSLMQESLQHRIMIHTLESTPYVSDSLSGQQDDLLAQVMDKTGYAIFTRSFVRLGFSAGYMAAFLWGVFGIRSGAVSFGMMTAFLQLVGQIQRPVMNLSGQLPALINSLTSSERLAEIEGLPSVSAESSINMGDSVGIRFTDVDYTYPDAGRAVLKDFSYDFKPGLTYALLGETGVGKSTLIRLMLGLLEPDKGKVELYNADLVRNVSSDTRCNFVYVPQGNTLMSGTIRENLLLGDPYADEEQMCDALYLAAADFVKDLPDGLDTMCGEHGSGLSEGQSQRISIARALLRKGAVLLLDEPTSSLDVNTEEVLLSRLTAHIDGKTLIMVTHRPKSAALCRCVVKMEQQA